MYTTKVQSFVLHVLFIFPPGGVSVPLGRGSGQRHILRVARPADTAQPAHQGADHTYVCRYKPFYRYVAS